MCPILRCQVKLESRTIVKVVLSVHNKYTNLRTTLLRYSMVHRIDRKRNKWTFSFENEIVTEKIYNNNGSILRASTTLKLFGRRDIRTW